MPHDAPEPNSNRVAAVEPSIYDDRFTSLNDFISLKGRERIADPSRNLQETLAKAELYPDCHELGTVATDAEARKNFTELYAILIHAVNDWISIAVKNDANGPLSFLCRKLFYSAKALFGVKISQGYSREIYRWDTEYDLRRTFLLASAVQTVKEAFDLCKDTADREAFVRELLDEIGFSDGPEGVVKISSDIPLPKQPPALWLEREKRKETPPDFIAREYAPWLGHGLTQAHILHLDKSLYTALHKWLRTNEMPAYLDLPTKKEMNDRKIEEYREKGSTEGMSARDYLRVRAAAARRFG